MTTAKQPHEDGTAAPAVGIPLDRRRVRPQWSSNKPTVPGLYWTRHADTKRCQCEVEVRRRGRGLQVHCASFNDTVPMSLIGDDELEWALRPNAKLSGGPAGRTE